jgi:hypothetical protein
MVVTFALVITSLRLPIASLASFSVANPPNPDMANKAPSESHTKNLNLASPPSVITILPVFFGSWGCRTGWRLLVSTLTRL